MVAKESQKQGDGKKAARFTPKFLIFFLVVVFVGVAVALAAWFFFSKDTARDGAEKKPPQVEEVQQTDEKRAEPLFNNIVELEPFERIELKPSGNMTAVTLGIALEVVTPDMREEVEANKVSIRKLIETQINETTWLVLRNPEGKLALKFELIKKINQNLTRAKIRDLFFTNLMMQ